jgi:aryl-alcohol dehydrogenase-like predicted oxidoreductase
MAAMTTDTFTQRQLGSTGLTVTPLGLGGAYLGYQPQPDGPGTIDDELGIATVLRALELGINLIDTSGAYMGGGRSERIIGQALTRWFAAGGQREALVISTKTGTRDRHEPPDVRYSGEATRHSIEASLQALGSGYLDIALIHDPPDLGPVLARGGAWDTLKAMKGEGLIRAIGLGVRDHAMHRRMLETGECEVCLTHHDFNLLDQSAVEGVIRPAVARGAGVLNATSLYAGLLGGRNPEEVVEQAPHHWRGQPRWRTEGEERVREATALWEWCQAWGVSLLALNLQFCARPWFASPDLHVAATLMGAATPGQIEEDVAAMSVDIPDTMWAEVAERLNGASRRD